tara:strand:+ start:296 stop:739 length:444 start_codon:yes stop_codon:yes gene_type:complete
MMTIKNKKRKNEFIVQKYNKFKPIIINNLKGSHVIFIKRVSRNDETTIIIGLFTNPSCIMRTLARHFSIYDKFTIIIKTPKIIYFKDDQVKFKTNSLFYNLKKVKNIDLRIIPYSHKTLNKYETSFVVMKNCDSLIYTNNDGSYGNV